MATFVKGDPVANATSYELLEKKGDTYAPLVTGSEISFEVSALGLAFGDHTLVVKAKADGYADSEYSNEVIYTVEGSRTPVSFRINAGFYATENHSLGYGAYVNDNRFSYSSVFAVKAGQRVIVYSSINRNVCALLRTDVSGTPVGTEALIAEGPDVAAYEAKTRTYIATEDMYCVACNAHGNGDAALPNDQWTITLEG